MVTVEHGFGAFLTSVFHPLSYAKFLIQIGHEPMKLYQTRTFTGKPMLAYPSVFRYIGHIYHVDGFFGLYKGLVPKVLAGAAGSIIQNKILLSLKSNEDTDVNGDESDEETLADSNQDDDADVVIALKKLSKIISKQLVARSVAIIATHPLQVIMARNMAQFVGREKEYSGIISAAMEILKVDGPSGFFGGLVPRLLGDSINLASTSILTYILNKYIIQDKKVSVYTAAFVGLLVNQLTYPFGLVSVVMMVNGSGLIAAMPPNMPFYRSWVDCWNHLSSIVSSCIHFIYKRNSSNFLSFISSTLSLVLPVTE
ncbi:mitochondrial carrier homolog 2 [Octopus bimaculoides]|uniref:mitochondrial carrier homolog 2 n=1 Tax=Octopus bimaculoides TaxID=37653 RepID=UPI0022DF6E7C|nr:mitochondrial carrier homolog 2 [Octopus bimaculoides]